MTGKTKSPELLPGFSFYSIIKSPHLQTKLITIKTISIRIPSRNAGMVYFVGRAARLVITTSASDAMAPIIREKMAPLNKIADMVTGKKMADMAVMDMPTQAIRFFSSLIYPGH